MGRKRTRAITPKFEPELRKCSFCGKEFMPVKRSNIYCSAECRYEHDKIWQRAYHRNIKKTVKAKRISITDIQRMAVEAGFNGNEYGKFVALNNL